MGENIEQNRQFIGLMEEKLIGVEEELIPYHLVRYCLREGSSETVSAGMTIYCLVDIYLADGTQIVSSKGNKITKYLFGRNRLIRGLEIGLAGIQKQSKWRIIISPQYGYGLQNDISLIPEGSKLIFEVDILDFMKINFQKMGDVELYYEVYYHLDEAEKAFRRRNEDDGLSSLAVAYRYAKKIKHYKCAVVGKILLKWGNVLYHRGDYQNSLMVVNRIQRYDETLEDCFRLQIKLYQALKLKQQLETLVEKMYQQHLQDNDIKRICVNYYKEVQNWDKLKKLQGYDFKKDRFTEIKQVERGMPFRIFF